MVSPWIGLGIAIGSLAVSLASLCLAFLAWDVNRPRAAWRLSHAVDGVAVLTYIGWRRHVRVDFVQVPHGVAPTTTDERGDIVDREFRRHQWAQLDVTGNRSGDVVVICWTGLWRNRQRPTAFPLVMTGAQDG